MNTKLRSQILWLVVFVVGAIFQLWRGSPIDTLIYSTVAILILISRQTWFERFEFKTIRYGATRLILLLGTLVFLIFPIHGWPTAVSYLLLLPASLSVVLQKDFVFSDSSTGALRRSSKIWFTIGSLTCICELGNYFASDITHDDKSYPTLTVLVDPFVANSAGKVVFVLVWAWIGAGLFRIATVR